MADSNTNQFADRATWPELPPGQPERPDWPDGPDRPGGPEGPEFPDDPAGWLALKQGSKEL